MSNRGASNQRIALLAATIVFATALHRSRASARRGDALTDLQHAQEVQASIEAGKEARQGIKTSKPLPDVPGKEVLVMTVTYPPGGSSSVHRHNAHAFVYVLEGSIVMGVTGSKPLTLMRGQTFYEGPNDIHTISRNASNTEPARFLVFLLKDEGAPVVIPVQ